MCQLFTLWPQASIYLPTKGEFQDSTDEWSRWKTLGAALYRGRAAEQQ